MKIRYHTTLPGREALLLRRRGLTYGWIESEAWQEDHSALGFTQVADVPEPIVRAWNDHQAVFLPGLLRAELPRYADALAQARHLYLQTLEGKELSALLEEEPYVSRWQADFALSGASFEEHDPQGIEKVYFDAWAADDLVADDLWCKASWLSFHETDDSLRFRFSFGMEGYEDVAADPLRQHWAARLTDAIFPESAAVTEHPGLDTILRRLLHTQEVHFVERIVYFNAPDGGAQMHHDVERGHDGVVFAQMSGATFWLALSKPVLLAEVQNFLACEPAESWRELRALVRDQRAFSRYLEEPDHELAEALIDRSPAFCRHLSERGYAYVLYPGDVLLLRQHSLETCVWHSVFCLGDEAGEGLSFAIKGHAP